MDYEAIAKDALETRNKELKEEFKPATETNGVKISLRSIGISRYSCYS